MIRIGAIYARDPGPEPQHSKFDDALDRGYNPEPSDMLPPAAHLELAADDPWAIALAASVEEAQRLQHGCGVEDCGQRRCDRCDERLMCTGPEPRACGTTCVECPCDCPACAEAAQDREDERRFEIARDERWA